MPLALVILGATWLLHPVAGLDKEPKVQVDGPGDGALRLFRKVQQDVDDFHEFADSGRETAHDRHVLVLGAAAFTQVGASTTPIVASAAEVIAAKSPSPEHASGPESGLFAMQRQVQARLQMAMTHKASSWTDWLKKMALVTVVVLCCTPGVCFGLGMGLYAFRARSPRNPPIDSAEVAENVGDGSCHQDEGDDGPDSSNTVPIEPSAPVPDEYPATATHTGTVSY